MEAVIIKNFAPNEENQTSTEQLEDAQKNSQDANVDDGGVDLGDVLEVAVDFVSSFFED